MGRLEKATTRELCDELKEAIDARGLGFRVAVFPNNKQQRVVIMPEIRGDCTLQIIRAAGVDKVAEAMADGLANAIMKLADRVKEKYGKSPQGMSAEAEKVVSAALHANPDPASPQSAPT